MKITEIADFLAGKLIANDDTEILRVAAIDTAQKGEITFIEKAETLFNTNASCIIVPQNFDIKVSFPLICVENPKLAFAKIAAKLHSPELRSGRHETAIIASHQQDIRADFIGAFVSIGENCNLSEGTRIYENVKIGNGTKIGRNTIIYPNCVIYDSVSIGDNCVIHAGAVIGADGFGFVRDGAEGYVKFPQIGTIFIEDNVEIGANTCIDRGALGETRIGAGTKIDNLVQIAHNVRIGKRVVIAAQTGISGSTIIEDDCVIGGQVGMGDHAIVKSGAVIGSQAGVLPGKIVRSGVWWGTPVQPLDQYKRQNAMIKGLERLRNEVSELKRQIAELLKK